MSPVRFRESGPPACPSSVVAYHAALSRLRLGFEFRLGRFCVFTMNLTAIVAKDNSKEFQDFLSLYRIAFPPEEQIPDELFWYSIHMEGAKVTTYYAEEILGKKFYAGFSFVIETEQFLFLYFLAVNPEIRSKGIGSEIIQNHLMKQYPGKTIVLNVESPDELAEDNHSRLRRIAFYERLGFVQMNCSFTDGCVMFSVLSTSSELDLNAYVEFLRKLCGCDELPDEIDIHMPSSQL